MKRTVLVVEDSADIREIMRIVFRTYGYNVLEAADGYEALQLALEHHPDIILMDLALPLLDGLKATCYIRAEKALSEVPILAVTAYGELYKDEAIEVGCNAVITKPVDFKNLHTVVEHYLT